MNIQNEKLKTLKAKLFIFSSFVIIAALFSSIVFVVNHTQAEQSSGSPESGATSRIKTVYDALSVLSYGSDAAGGWGDWGAYWNRIRSAGEWVPSDGATTTDVKNGVTYHSTSRTQATGTYPNPTSCSTQAYHDSSGSGTEANNCSLTWTVPGGAAGTDKQDPRTGLIWSYPLYRNGTVIEFSSTLNTAFSWNNGGANNQGITAPVAGNRTAIQLCADQGNGWRLPVQKELKQAYIDGSRWNLNQYSNPFWSATEYDPTNVWYANLHRGYSSNSAQTITYRVRCVR